MVIADSASRSHVLSYGRPRDASASSSVTLKVLIDPKVKVLGIAHMPDIIEVKDEKGNVLANPAATGQFIGSSGQARMGRFSIALCYFPDGGKRIAILKGAIRCRVLEESARWEIENIVAVSGATKEVGGVIYTVQSVKTSGPRSCEMKVVVDVSGGIKAAADRRPDFNAIMRGMRLVDAAGRAYHTGGGGGGGSDKHAEYSFNFSTSDQSAGLPAKLIWEIPTKIREVRVPFEFKDLALP